MKNYFFIKNANDESIRIKKQTFCWLLNGEHDKLSNDRIVRFQGSKHCRTQSSSAQPPDEDQIKIGDWCQFRQGKRSKIFGQIISFMYLNKKSKKEARYSLQSASINDEAIGVLASWFTVQKKKFKFKFIESLVPISNYMKHVEKPQLNSLVYK